MVKLTNTKNKKHPYKREVTHTEYPHGNKKVKKGGLSSVLQLHISENAHKLTVERVKGRKNISEANGEYMIGVVAQYVTAYWGGLG